MTEIVTLRDEGLGNSSYLVDLGDGRGLVLDPSRDPGPYLAAAARRGRSGWHGRCDRRGRRRTAAPGRLTTASIDPRRTTK